MATQHSLSAPARALWAPWEVTEVRVDPPAGGLISMSALPGAAGLRAQPAVQRGRDAWYPAAERAAIDVPVATEKTGEP